VSVEAGGAAESREWLEVSGVQRIATDLNLRCTDGGCRSDQGPAWCVSPRTSRFEFREGGF